MIKYLTDSHNNQIAYVGIGPEGGILPAFFYFALSGEESLTLPPYNYPIPPLASSCLRCFSFTLPGHGPGFDKLHAMLYWAKQMAEEKYLLEYFIEKILVSVQWLIDEQLVDPDKIAVGGLSRGGFIATHIAARLTYIRTVLGFAPLTRLSELKEFKETPHLKSRAQNLDLEQLVNSLTHVHNFRFYISNRDTRVSTDACYHFIRQFAEVIHAKRARHCHVELIITPSIGHEGHGTSLLTFEEGANWVKQHLITLDG